MLEQTFIFLPGVQEKTERMLWQRGIATWDHLLDAKSVPGVSKARLSFWKTRIREVQSLRSAGNVEQISRMLGSRFAWRAYQDIMREPRFVDIETTEYSADITVLGVSDGEFYQGYVKGRNLARETLMHAFKDASCIVTFNGSSFDLPIIERAFPGLLPSIPHLDARHICAQLGLRGGLKAIERELGIRRGECLRDTDGAEAIMLWYRYLHGEESALQELVDYNAADVLNLAPLLEWVIPRLWQQTLAEEPKDLYTTPSMEEHGL